MFYKMIERHYHFYLGTDRRPFFIKRLWWKYMTGARIAVAWPKNIKDPRHPTYRSFKEDNVIHAIVPTDELDQSYRPWLEKQAGIKGIDWDWELDTEKDSGDQITARLYLRFRKGKEKLATMAVLKWS